MTKYDGTVRRDGRWWMVRIPAVDGLTQARRLSEATRMAREYIAASQDVPLESVEVDLTFAPIGHVSDIDTRVTKITHDRERAAELEQEAIAMTATLVRDLKAADVPMRDIGAIVGISHQRVHQLTSAR